jgi:hypothetical protein
MANVFIFADDDATARSYFDITVKKEYELETLSPLIEDESQIEELRMIYPEGKCYFWGVQESGGNFSTWNMMAKDDLVLGYRNHSIVFASYVLMKMKNPLLASRLWGENTETPFSLMCFTDEPHLGDIPIIPQRSVYLDRNYRGFTCLNPEKRDNIVRDYGSFEVFVRLGLGLDFPFILRHSE